MMVEHNSASETIRSFSDRTIRLATAIDTELRLETLNSSAMSDEWSLLVMPLQEAIGELAAAPSDFPLAKTQSLQCAYLAFGDLSKARKAEPHEFLGALSSIVRLARQSLDGITSVNIDRYRFLNPETCRQRLCESLYDLFHTRSHDRSTLWIESRRAVLRAMSAWVADPGLFRDQHLLESLQMLHDFVGEKKEQAARDLQWGQRGYLRLYDWLNQMQISSATEAIACH